MDSRLVSPVLMWAIVLSGISICLLFLPASELAATGLPGRIVSAVSFVYWVGMFSASLFHHHEAHFSAKAVSRLVTSGPYRLVRNPIYSADIFFAWGIVAGFPQARLAAAALWLTAVMVRWSLLEEAALEKSFGKEYQDYKKATPRFLPDPRKIFGRG
jgi:protein-S-isoprenylcysteine O-methyltransferase Ste14